MTLPLMSISAVGVVMRHRGADRKPEMAKY